MSKGQDGQPVTLPGPPTRPAPCARPCSDRGNASAQGCRQAFLEHERGVVARQPIGEPRARAADVRTNGRIVARPAREKRVEVAIHDDRLDLSLVPTGQ